MLPKLAKLGICGFVLLILAINSLYIVNQTEYAIVLQFGEPVRIVKQPGLKMKIPFIQDLVFYDNRILDFNAPEIEVIAADQKRLLADAFVKFKISDPLLFYKALENELKAKSRLRTILDSSLRQIFSDYPLVALLTDQRKEIMSNIHQVVAKNARSLGIEVVDVRIKRADLPQGNSDAIYRRMQTDREKEARELRAQGIEEAQVIKSLADKEQRIIIAEALKEAQIIRGKADAEAAKIIAAVSNKDKDFYSFYRSLQSYKESIKDNNTSLILSPDSEFLRYLKSSN